MKNFLTLLLRDLEVNPIFPKRSIDWLIDNPVSYVEMHYLRMKKIGSKRKDEDKNEHTNLAPAVQQTNQNL